MHIINADAKSATRIRKTGRNTAQVKSYALKNQPSSKGGFKYFSGVALSLRPTRQQSQLQSQEAKHYNETLLQVSALLLPSRFRLCASGAPMSPSGDAHLQSSFSKLPKFLGSVRLKIPANYSSHFSLLKDCLDIALDGRRVSHHVTATKRKAFCFAQGICGRLNQWCEPPFSFGDVVVKKPSKQMA
jgi:hypothetical protein